MRALTIVYILLACTVAGYTQTTASYDNVRARQQLTLNGHTLTSVLQTIDSLSTHAQGVTAKAVYDYITSKYSTVSAGIGIDVVKAGSNYTISLDTLKRLHFRTDSTYSGGVGTMRWNLTDGTLDLGLLGGNVTLQLGQESVQRVKHADNSGLVEGNVVYIVGSSGDNMTVRYARANAESTSANTFGVMTESASGGNKAFCTTFGLVRNINTSNLTEGGMVWLSKDTAGAMTAVRPTAPNHGVEIGFCVRKHATTGVIFVTIQNGYELRELHDVYTPSPANNQGLLWKSANSRWEAVEVDTSLTNEGRLIGSKPSNNSYYTISSSTTGSTSITLYRGAGIGFSGNSGSPEGGDLTISNSGDLDNSNEGTLGVGAGTSTSSVITSNTSGASGVTVNAGGGISISETTSSNGGSITLSATDQSITNEGILGVATNVGADAWLRSNTSTANDIGLVGTNNTTITATTSSNGGQIIFDSKAQIDTFSVSGSTLSLSLKNDGEPAKTVTLPGGGGGGGTVTGTGVAGRAAFWRSTSAISSDANFAWDSINARLNLGPALTTSARLGVRGASDLSGSFSLICSNNSGTEFFRVRNDGIIQARGSYINLGTDQNVGIGPTTNGGGFSSSGGDVIFAGSNGGVNNACAAFNIVGGRKIVNSGVLWLNGGTFDPTSTSNTYSIIDITSSVVINQTGTASGITRGLYIRPTLTSAVNYRSIEWNNSTGWGIYGAGAAKSYFAGNVALGTTVQDASSALEVSSTTQGVLFPRMTTAQRDAITTPANGLVIYNSTTDKLQVRAGGAWVDLH